MPLFSRAVLVKKPLVFIASDHVKMPYTSCNEDQITAQLQKTEVDTTQKTIKIRTLNVLEVNSIQS